MLKFIFLLLAPFCLYVHSQTVYEQNILFRGQNALGNFFNYSFVNPTNVSQYCPVTGNFTILVHGWNEKFTTFWVNSMMNNFISNRNGCVFFMDYSFYSKLGYSTLVSHFNGIRAVLTKFLVTLQNIGFNPDLGWLFGFSYGAHLVFEGAYQYGPQRIGRVDACDPAGPSFPLTANSVIHANASAKSVQCIHTSCGYGKCDRYCQFDMNLGDCGNSQVAATAPPLLSHGLCPVFYNNSFVYDFKAIPKPTKCTARRTTVNITDLPQPILMGVRFDTNLPAGEYYFPTTAKYPYN